MAMDKAMVQGSRLHRLRTIRKLSIGQLTEISEINYSNVALYDAGLKEIPKNHGLIFSSILKCNYEYLMGGKDE